MCHNENCEIAAAANVALRIVEITNLIPHDIGRKAEEENNPDIALQKMTRQFSFVYAKILSTIKQSTE